MSGWICSYRKIWEHPIFAGNALRVGVWTWMLHTAAWKETRFRVGKSVMPIRRGQLCVSQRQIEAETGMGRQALRSFLDELEEEGAITRDKAHDATQGRTIITICKYDEYQVDNKPSNPRKTQEATQPQPTKEQGNNIPVGADASAPPPTPDKIMFDSGVQMLTAAGETAKGARSILARWRKDHGTEAVLAAISRAQREGAIDPVQFMQGCFRFQGKRAQPQIGEARTLPNGKVQEWNGPFDGWVNVIA